jgi:FkbM family methyltransferase
MEPVAKMCNDTTTTKDRCMPSRQVNSNLIIDVGVCEGDDTAFYMAKGFKVIGVEADPLAYSKLHNRFADKLASRDLILINRAADASSGTIVKFKADPNHRGSSNILRDDPGAVPPEDETADVETICWRDLTAVAGVPYYCKIDIEGSEKYFLRGFVGQPDLLPTYISAEIHTFEPIELLYAAGYRHFKVVNQCTMHLIKLPRQPLEGNYVANHVWRQSSGPFGRETPGRKWMDLQEVAGLFSLMLEVRRRLTVRDWFDVHAWLPE